MHRGEIRALKESESRDLAKVARTFIIAGRATGDRAEVSACPGSDVSMGCEAGMLGYVTGTYQYMGSRFTQVGDEDLDTLDLLSFGANTIARL